MKKIPLNIKTKNRDNLTKGLKRLRQKYAQNPIPRRCRK